MRPGNLPSWDPRWKRRYNSPPDDLIQDFYLPAFARSSRYDRAVGFFSSHLLGTIAPALDQFVLLGGAMRLITSPANLSESDLQAMGKGEQVREGLRKSLVHSISRPIPSQILRDRLRLLTWMVASDALDVRIALREHPAYYSLFHEKIGVFIDEDENWMTFSGSPNETVGGALRHSESFPLHRSWANDEQLAFAKEERDRFADIWTGRVDGIVTWRANEWIAEPMREYFGAREPSLDMMVPRDVPPVSRDSLPLRNSPQLNQDFLLPKLPSELILRQYQKDAVNRWLKEGGRGIFAMATGTGKTITALSALTRLSEAVARDDRSLLIIVTVPSRDLVTQWHESAKWFGFRPAICHGSLKRSEKQALKSIFSSARSGFGRRAEMVITTAGSLTPRSGVPQSERDHFLQRQIARHKGRLCFIGDEMHSLGTDLRLAALPPDPHYTLGLSATPKRHGDEVGTEALLAYFGDPVISIDIKQAIYEYDALVPYDYHPERVELTSEERERYLEISKRIAAAYAAEDEDAAERHIRERTRLTQHAANKQVRLRELMAGGLKNETHQIIYVAEGKHWQSDLKQLEEIETLLSEEFGMSVARYVGETSGDRREILQLRLGRGEIQALLAMKCLDAGVDIPSVRIGVITASTQNPRQFVQRRGRLLRKDPQNPKTHAIIYDFIVMPPRPTEGLTDSEKTLIGRELSRAAELADAARNREVFFDLLEWAYNYQLDPTVFTWMNLSQDETMEEWFP